jgi:glutamate racemase
MAGAAAAAPAESKSMAVAARSTDFVRVIVIVVVSPVLNAFQANSWRRTSFLLAAPVRTAFASQARKRSIFLQLVNASPPHFAGMQEPFMDIHEPGAIDQRRCAFNMSATAIDRPNPAMPSPAIIPIAEAPTMIVFDSGLGGLTVLRELVRARPDARFIYAADDALFPYGALEETRLIARVTDLIGDLMQRHDPDLVVIACNTASTIVMPALRARFTIPFVGTVPAIKPACAASITRRVSVLGTEATVRREYTHALVRQFGQGCKVTLAGSAQLAAMAEAELAGHPASDAAVSAEIAPCFIDDGARTDTVVLGCTHYPLLLNRFAALAPWPVRWIDPAPAIARRVVELLGPAAREGDLAAVPEITFTSGRAPPPALDKVFMPASLEDPLQNGPRVLRDAVLADRSSG